MSRTLRPSVETSLLLHGVQLTDAETGFAVELSDTQLAMMNGQGVESDRLWARLDDLGLTDGQSDLAAIRSAQREALARSAPPLLRRLRERLAEVCETVPYFRQRSGLYRPGALASLDEFASLPFMHKSDLRRNFPNGLIPVGIDVASGLRDGSLAIIATSGSTEDRIQVVARTVIDRLPFGCDDLFGVPIGGKQPRTAFFTAPACSTGGCSSATAPFEQRRSRYVPDLILCPTEDPFDIRRPLVDSFCQDVERFRPTILHVDPIYLQCLVRQAGLDGVTLPRVPLVLTGYEFGHRAALRDLRRAFGAPVLNDYGASEENRLAIECHRGSLHVRADVIHLEIVNSTGRCPPGVVGAVAITTFDSLTPLVRYLIGDAAAWTGRTCDCAFADWPTIELHGRLKDALRARGQWVTTLDVDIAIDAPEWLAVYRITQLEPSRFLAQVIPAAGMEVDFRDLALRLEQLLDPDDVRFEAVTRLDPLRSMKIGLTQSRLDGAPELP
jgi:phenylacetate-CoA ligase